MANSSTSPIFTGSLVDQVYNHLLNRIQNNELTYGDNLNIKDLSEELQISTMPVREAIKRLEFDGLVDIKPRSSCQIRTHEKNEIREFYEIREVLELFSIKKFLKNYNSEKLASLRTIIKEMEAATHIKSDSLRTRKLITLDHDFHAALCELSENRNLKDYHKHINLHLNMTIIHNKTYEQLAEKHYQSHKIILDFLEKKSDEAIKSLEQHFENVWKLLD